MNILLIVVLPALLLLMGVPIFVVLLAAAVSGMSSAAIRSRRCTPRCSATSTFFRCSPCPLFIYAGDIMSRGGMARRLIELIMSLVGAVRGALGIATIAACEVFSVMSGSSVACVAAIGKITIPSLKKRLRRHVLGQPGDGDRRHRRHHAAFDRDDHLRNRGAAIGAASVLPGFRLAILIGIRARGLAVLNRRASRSDPDHGPAAERKNVRSRRDRARSGRCSRPSSSSAASMADCSRRPKRPAWPASTRS